MPILRRHKILSALALWAALAQLWLGTLHASMAGAAFCGDGSAGRAAALQQQLPPELRLPLERLDGTPQADCKLCALSCSAALPAPAAIADWPKPAPLATSVALPAHPSVGPVPLPPPRGPPATR
ncbi:hypothetical protein E4T66_20100 [Sinimarinibacterium sp. CAU 1509]|uniref:hypothetical protein n=1 Tax=Sinimarinibacterium sp. CAU 1509 TaxID=2562283 RepID=UPI0010AD1C06|nr:hypothetical protein [Sinimarinibacterium sp. CAU 1509]TJY56262.1 hypothetical protein E4T66_20100 [Sinimarinibacterium sp. CAU 1509]